MSKQREFVFARKPYVVGPNGETAFATGSMEVGSFKEQTIQRLRDMGHQPTYLVRMKYKNVISEMV